MWILTVVIVPYLILASTSARIVLTDELLANIDKIRTEQNVKGLAISVIHDGIAKRAVQGIRTETGEPMEEDTLFHIASCSKSFTAAAMGLLIDDFQRGVNVTALPAGVDRLDWHSKMKDILPDEWKLMDPVASENANIHDILSHVTGLPRHDEVVGAKETPLGLVKNLRNLRPSYELRERWSYNNLMFVVATHVITKYSGKRFVDFVQERLFRPMNMTSTTYILQNTHQLTSVWTKNGRLIPNHLSEDPDFIDVEAGPGGVISNSVDLARYLDVMVNRGVDPSSGTVIIPEHVWTAIMSPYSVISASQTYGMGWIISSYRDVQYISHTGGIPGYTSLLLWIPSTRQGLCLLMNGDIAVGLLQHVQSTMLDAFLGSKQPLEFVAPDSDDQQALSKDKRTPSTTVDISEMLGTYSSPGYPDITLCATSGTLHLAKECSAVLNTFSTLGPLDTSHLYASWGDNIWFSHVRLTPHKKPEKRHQFDFEETQLYPHGYGKDTTPFEQVVIGQMAEFDVVDGIVRGFGLTDPSAQPTLRRGVSIEEQAIVWFVKTNQTQPNP